MQRCEVAEECCVCDVPFCPYSDGDILIDGMYPDEWGDGEDEDEDEEEEEGW